MPRPSLRERGYLRYPFWGQTYELQRQPNLRDLHGDFDEFLRLARKVDNYDCEYVRDAHEKTVQFEGNPWLRITGDDLAARLLNLGIEDRLEDVVSPQDFSALKFWSAIQASREFPKILKYEGRAAFQDFENSFYSDVQQPEDTPPFYADVFHEMIHLAQARGVAHYRAVRVLYIINDCTALVGAFLLLSLYRCMPNFVPAETKRILAEHISGYAREKTMDGIPHSKLVLDIAISDAVKCVKWLHERAGLPLPS